MKKLLFFLAIYFTFCTAKSQSLYFPPLNPSVWDTISAVSLGWCTDKIDPLYTFLEQENTKAFILLKDGKIVLEKYFDNFTKDSIWYWASAGKTITSFLIGKANEDGILSVSDITSKYLGKGWTNCTAAQEDKITIRNQLTMTTGLDDGVPDNHCILDTCLNYLADAGSRWAYHNAPYTLLEKVLTTASSQPINTYTQQKLKSKTGITGLWFTLDYDNIYFSTARSMARFGLLFQNKCIWNSDTLLRDTAYINQMTSTSQLLNKSYGYLWWLNGKASYMVPGSQIVIPGSYAPQAPADMFAGLGKNGQIVSISRSKGLVFVRMGDAPASSGEITTVFCNQIWQKLNDIICNSTSIQNSKNQQKEINVFPNPATTELNIVPPLTEYSKIEVINTMGETVIIDKGLQKIDISALPDGVYLLRIGSEKNQSEMKFIKY